MKHIYYIKGMSVPSSLFVCSMWDVHWRLCLPTSGDRWPHRTTSPRQFKNHLLYFLRDVSKVSLRSWVGYILTLCLAAYKPTEPLYCKSEWNQIRHRPPNWIPVIITVRDVFNWRKEHTFAHCRVSFWCACARQPVPSDEGRSPSIIHIISTGCRGPYLCVTCLPWWKSWGCGLLPGPPWRSSSNSQGAYLSLGTTGCHWRVWDHTSDSRLKEIRHKWLSSVSSIRSSHSKQWLWPPAFKNGENLLLLSSLMCQMPSRARLRLHP